MDAEVIYSDSIACDECPRPPWREDNAPVGATEKPKPARVRILFGPRDNPHAWINLCGQHGRYLWDKLDAIGHELSHL